MRIQTWNVSELVPQDWIGFVDLVHVRLLYPRLGAGTISDSGKKASPVEVARKLKKMLSEFFDTLRFSRTTNRSYHEEPGGYLQWDECDLESRLLNYLALDNVGDILEAAKPLYSGICRAIGGDYLPWTAKLQKVSVETGLQDI